MYFRPPILIGLIPMHGKSEHCIFAEDRQFLKQDQFIWPKVHLQTALTWFLAIFLTSRINALSRLNSSAR